MSLLGQMTAYSNMPIAAAFWLSWQVREITASIGLVSNWIPTNCESD